MEDSVKKSEPVQFTRQDADRLVVIEQVLTTQMTELKNLVSQFTNYVQAHNKLHETLNSQVGELVRFRKTMIQSLSWTFRILTSGLGLILLNALAKMLGVL